ncbi:hypothetical protein SH611_13660 [Geminicoccaceae bacterium 1502E]|nr:hypothetical protein [Geminicoccaceae bacterium 1502E]
MSDRGPRPAAGRASALRLAAAALLGVVVALAAAVAWDLEGVLRYRPHRPHEMPIAAAAPKQAVASTVAVAPIDLGAPHPQRATPAAP